MTRDTLQVDARPTFGFVGSSPGPAFVVLVNNQPRQCAKAAESHGSERRSPQGRSQSVPTGLPRGREQEPGERQHEHRRALSEVHEARRSWQDVRAGEAQIGDAGGHRQQIEGRVEERDHMRCEKRRGDEQRQCRRAQQRAEQRRQRTPEQQRRRRIEQHECRQPERRLGYAEQSVVRRREALERQHQQRERDQSEPNREGNGEQPTSVELEVGERTRTEGIGDKDPPIARGAVERQGKHAQQQRAERETAVSRHVQARRRRLTESVRPKEVEIKAEAQANGQRREDPGSRAASHRAQLLDKERHNVGDGHFHSALLRAHPAPLERRRPVS